MLKRTLDVAVSALLLTLLSPLLALIAIAVLCDSGRPVLFRQKRIGRGFRPFDIYKFRSMRSDPAGPAITAATDSRITRVGRLLRASKLDELPQLWNVLRGQMSLVGPRPEVPRYVEQFRPRYQSILTVRPGITDFASLEFRNEEQLLARAADPLLEYTRCVLPRKLDLADRYVRERSLALDVSILFQTLFACVSLPLPWHSRTSSHRL